MNIQDIPDAYILALCAIFGLAAALLCVILGRGAWRWWRRRKVAAIWRHREPMLEYRIEFVGEPEPFKPKDGGDARAGLVRAGSAEPSPVADSAAVPKYIAGVDLADGVQSFAIMDPSTGEIVEFGEGPVPMRTDTQYIRERGADIVFADDPPTAKPVPYASGSPVPNAPVTRAEFEELKDDVANIAEDLDADFDDVFSRLVKLERKNKGSGRQEPECP